MQHVPRFCVLSTALFACTLLLFAPHQARASEVTVTMIDNQFTPKNVTINVGDTVTWINRGSVAHTATADSGLFDSGSVQPGQQFSVTFNQTGAYAYHCTFHGGAGGVGMAGTITVSGATAPVGATPYASPNATYSNPGASTPGVPAAPAANGVAQLYAQVQALLAQISALQAQRGPGSASAPGAGAPAHDSSSCPLIGRVLKLGSSGDDVTRLQQFLARDPSIYPEAVVSGYFGALTQSAVQRWQTKYNIVSSGTPETTGFGVAGPRTAAAISLLCTTGTTGGSASGASAPVGGFIQVTPITGIAPLSVGVTAIVNTGGSCAGAIYTLNFGDPTVPVQIPVSAGNCSQQSQTYPHTYLSPGAYQVTLSAGSHTTSATVTVGGVLAPVGGTVGAGVGEVRGTISTFTTSGNAPLNVTFYVSCAQGTAYNVVFGDGTDLGSTAVSGTKCGAGGLDAVSHTYTKSGSFPVQLIIFAQQRNGTVTPASAATATITVTSVVDNYVYSPPQLSPGSSTLNFSVQFDLPTSCTGYDLSWGDGTADVIQTDGGSSCAQTTTITTKSHTYAHAGSYTLTLRRGASLARADTIAVTVTQ